MNKRTGVVSACKEITQFVVLILLQRHHSHYRGTGEEFGYGFARGTLLWLGRYLRPVVRIVRPPCIPVSHSKRHKPSVIAVGRLGRIVTSTGRCFCFCFLSSIQGGGIIIVLSIFNETVTNDRRKERRNEGIDTSSSGHNLHLSCFHEKIVYDKDYCSDCKYKYDSNGIYDRSIRNVGISEGICRIQV